VPEAFAGASVPDALTYAGFASSDDPRNAEAAALPLRRRAGGPGHFGGTRAPGWVRGSGSTP
jgi:hypothetical protein